MAASGTDTGSGSDTTHHDWPTRVGIGPVTELAVPAPSPTFYGSTKEERTRMPHVSCDRRRGSNTTDVDGHT